MKGFTRYKVEHMLESSVHGTCVCKQYSTNTKGKINKLLTLLRVSANSLLNLLVSVHRLDRRSLVSSRISSNLYTCKFCGFDARAANQGGGVDQYMHPAWCYCIHDPLSAHSKVD